jgi:hypothetical protein
MTLCNFKIGTVATFLVLSLGSFNAVQSAELGEKYSQNDPLSSLKKEMLDEAQRINDYFVNAVRVYIFLGEEKAHIAALTAGKVAGNIQRKSMCNYLEAMAGDVMKSAPLEESARKRIAMMLLGLKDEIEEKEWDISDIKKGKSILRKMDPDYAKALDQADPSIFPRRHPKLFEDR